jgi:hypothetical protein
MVQRPGRANPLGAGVRPCSGSVVAQIGGLEGRRQLGLGVGTDLGVMRERQAVRTLPTSERLKTALVVAQVRPMASDH